MSWVPGRLRSRARSFLTSFALLAGASFVFHDALIKNAEAYELDGAERSPTPGARLACPQDDLVFYAGLVIRYSSAGRAHPAFVERLIRFERLVKDVSIRHFGRAPSRIIQLGIYYCRLVEHRERISEHAFGNAIDVAGFSFPPITQQARAKMREAGQELPRPLANGFQVMVKDIWRAQGGNPAYVAFITDLLNEVGKRDDIFRAVIGPPDPAHYDHLHFDAGRAEFNRYDLPTASR